MFGIRQRTGVRSERRRSLRTSLALLALGPALVLAGVGGYAASTLLRHGAQLRAETELVRSLGIPAHKVVASLQQERRHTAVRQAGSSSAAVDALETRRQRTDAAAAEYRRQIDAVVDDADAHVAAPARQFRDALADLSRQRTAIDDQSASRASAFDTYTETIAQGKRLLNALSRTVDGHLAHRMNAITALLQKQEMISREDAILSAALAADKLSAAAQTEFAGYVTARRLPETEQIAGDLPDGLAQRYEGVTASPGWSRMVSIEQSVRVGGSTLPTGADEWRGAIDRIVPDLREINRASLDEVLDEATARADGLLLRAFAGAAAALVALALLAVVLGLFTRSLLGRLSRANASVRDANDQLSDVAARLERGEDVEVAPEQPGNCGTDEIGGLADDVARLRHTAESTVIQQARGREGTTKILVNLARRTQILVHREISMLDAMERSYEDPELLEKLFAVDHTATRVRRHAENLLLLGGSLAPRGPEESAPLVDVLRSAISETEQYLRVDVETQVPRRSLVGPAGNDVIHLIAELVENGTSFSPPHTKVEVRAEEVPNGLVIEVEDRGLGMKAEDYDYHNERLAHPPAPEMVLRGEDSRLGLFVVARLAQRHGIEVSLRRSRYGGTCAIILLPPDLLEKPAAEAGTPGLLPAGARVVTSKAPDDSSESPEEGGHSRSTDGLAGLPEPRPASVSQAVEPHTGTAAATSGATSERTEGKHAMPAEDDMPESSPPQKQVTSRGFPKRERGANLAPRLHEPQAPPEHDSGSGTQPDSTPNESSPEQLSNVLAAIHRGAVRAQAAAEGGDRELQAETPDSAPDVLPSTEDERDADADPR